MERNIQKVGALNFIILLVAGGVSYILARYCNSMSGQVGAVFFGVGVLVALISFFQMGLEEKERIEKLEFDEISREKNAASLFSNEAETFPARRSREQFERFFLPGFTVLLLILEGSAAVYLWRWLDEAFVTAPRQPFVALALYAVLALVLFLLGKYSANIARFEKQRLLRPGASFLVLGAYICALIVLSLALIYFGLPRADIWLARVLAVVLGLAAAESLLNLILEIYRPRVRGKVERLVYESRVLGLLASPEGIFTTAAHALDYQFGFKVSETWVYRFFEKALAWLILLQFIVLVVSSCFVFINPGEQGLLERFGKPASGEQILGPGLHVKAPWPVDQVYRFRTEEIQSFRIGGESDDDHGSTITWSVQHEAEPFNLMVAARVNRSAQDTNTLVGGVPVDLLTVGIPVQFQIRDILAYAYNYIDAGKVLENIATREVVRYLVGVDLFDVMSTGKAQAAEELKNAIQKRADELKLGVEILLVGLEDIHPPQKVAGAFEDVVGARQESESMINQAHGYAAQTTNLAHGNAIKLVREAEAFRSQRVRSSAAEAEQFKNRVMAFEASPDVYRTRAYLQALMNNATNSRFFVNATTNTQDVFELDLQEKVNLDMSDLTVPPKK